MKKRSAAELMQTCARTTARQPARLTMNLLAIEIGGTKTQFFAGTDAGEILERRRFAVSREEGAYGIRANLAAASPADSLRAAKFFTARRRAKSKLVMSDSNAMARSSRIAARAGAWTGAFARKSPRIPRACSQKSSRRIRPAAKQNIWRQR